MKVLNNQRLIDLCMQEYGDPALLFDLALGVDKSITDELEAVFELEMPVLETTATGKSISQVLKKILNNPASADDSFHIPTIPPSGIGYMRIKNPASPQANDFIVS